MTLLNSTASVFVQKAPVWLYVLVYNALLAKRNGVKVSRGRVGWLIEETGNPHFSLLSPTPKFLSVKTEDLRNKLERVFKINKGDTVLDVGSSIGDTTKYMASRTQTGRIIAIEPEHLNVQYLRLNLSMFSDVVIYEMAAWNKTETLNLHTHSTPTGHSLISGDNRNGLATVKADTLDNILAGQHIDYAKIDVQGAEIEVLQGADKFLKSINRLLVETHHRHTEARTYPAVLQFLKPYNFKTYYCDLNGIVYLWRGSLDG